VAWWTVQATINAAAVLLPNIDAVYARRPGIDEHRYRRVRWFRDETGGWRRSPGCRPSSTPTAVKCRPS
jgi:transposase